VAEISATVTGEVPGAAVLEWWTPSERRGRESMSLVGDTQLVTSLGQLSEDICFRIVGGDEHTREFVIEATERPCVMHTLARITPPAYTHLDPAVIEQQTVLEILQGSTLELVARLNKAVKSARFVDSDGLAVPCEITWTDAAEPQPCVRVLWPEPSSGVYRFELVDYDHLANRNPVRYTLKAVPDRPPTVQMELTGVGELVTPQAELPVELRCEDAYGLKAVRLRAEVVAAGASATGPAAASAPEGFSPGSRSFSTKLAFSVGSSGTVAGDRVRLWAEAEDINPRGPNVAATSVTTLRVVSRDEFLMEMARRELGLRQEFERLRSTQRALKDSVERILPGLPEEGRPPEPVAQRLGGLARSQAEQASRSLAVARSFDQILTEMQVSRVARPADERRITERVVEPLGQLAREAMPAAADALTALRRAVTGEGRQACAAAQDALLRQMDEILANMLEWEGYREAVALLQEAIEAQTQVRSETLQALERQLEDILGLEPAAEDSRPAPAMP
jgi:hypothetical protein